MRIKHIIPVVMTFLLLIIFNTNVQAQPKGRIASAGTGEWISQAVGSGWSMSNRHYADFNGDGKDDIFIIKNGQFLMSSAATTSWETLNTRFVRANFSIHDLRFGDFNGDQKEDVFFEWKGNYGYISAGKGAFIPLRKADLFWQP